MSVVGIDFGTSTTAALVSDGGAATFVRDSQGHEILPSIIGWSANGRVHSGYAAKARLLIDPTNTLASFKRILGKTWRSPAVQRFRQQYPNVALQPAADDLPRF